MAKRIYVKVPPEQFAKYLEAAEQGDADAALEVAHSYSTGNGVKKNEVAAAEWLSKSVAGGCLKARKMVSAALDDDYRQRFSSFHSSLRFARQGDTEAMLKLYADYKEGQIVEECSVKANEWLNKAAELGNEHARITLAIDLAIKQQIDIDEAFSKLGF